jgi:hypothetical protein
LPEGWIRSTSRTSPLRRYSSVPAVSFTPSSYTPSRGPQQPHPSADQECAAQGDHPDAGLEDYMAQLDRLQADLKREYERRRAAGEQLLPYDLVIGQARFRKL